MKKALVFAALTMMSASAFASKARVAALGTTVTVADDVQEVFVNPAKMFGFGDMLTIEYAATNPEGGFFRSSGDTKYGIYLGHRSSSFSSLVTATQNVSATAIGEQNPFEIFYGSKMGDSAWGLSFLYSNANDKVAKAKSSTMGLRAGYNTDAFEVYANLGLAGTTEVENTVTGKSDMTVRIGGEYFMGDSTVYADVLSGAGKVTPNGGADVKITKMDWTVGYETKVRSEAAHFFYGVKLASEETKVGDQKTTAMKLPLYAGVEGDAASWLALRGFVQQSVLLNSNKVDPGNGAAATTDKEGMNDTSTGLGASLKFGKLWIDGTLSANNSGTLNTDTLLATTSLNYWF